MLRTALLVAFLVPCTAAAQDASALLKRASAAIGADDVKTLRYSGTGMAGQFGQAYEAGKAWPRLTLLSYARTVDYANGAFREDIVRTRAEPTGGGAVPLTGEQKLSQFVSGSHAWNVVGPAPAPAVIALAPRIHDLWTTPHGVIKAAQKNNATVEWRTVGGKELAAVSFTEPGRFTATAYLNNEYLVERIESRFPSPVLGDTASVTVFEGWRQFGSLRFPGRIRQTQGGFPTLDLEVKEVQAGVAADIQVPPNVSGFGERVLAENPAPGVWYLAGASHHSVAIEMKDHMIVIESPLYDGRALPMLETADNLVHGKKVRYVVNSHPHFDHAGGLRTAAARGATIVVAANARDYFAKALAAPSRISPDLLAKSGKKGKVMGVGAKHVFKDATRTVEIHSIAGGVHANGFLMAYLPKERLLVEADAYTPLAPNAPAPSPANANNVNLVENVERLKLDVDRILPLHGRIVPMGELYRTIGKPR
jgi:glyoxylase-like metal-dependent hydrolase (beta-lactamase superfamily II)